MKIFTIRKDGGPESTVTGYWLVEIKSLFSICILRFDGKSREAYHNHAFNCFSWVIKGGLVEYNLNGPIKAYPPSLMPFITRRNTFHKVSSPHGTSWVLSFRGPWTKRWREWLPERRQFVTLTNGRMVVEGDDE